MNKNKRNSSAFYLVVLLLLSAVLVACGPGGNNGGGGSPNLSLDSDNDTIADALDLCPMGIRDWMSNTSTTDHDGDGCRDSDEDEDDDNDMVLDSADTCPAGSTGWTSNTNTDTDRDGCQDGTAEEDLDNDGVADSADTCPAGMTGWTSDTNTDTDSDGCQDGTSEEDLDNDGVADNLDVDDDGDGLIEILNAASLNSVRYNLAGTGLDLTNTDNDNEAGGSSMGCGNGTRAGIDITTCNGYELMQDIDLNDLIGETAPDNRMYRVENNWERIGSCAIGPLSGTNTLLESRLCDTSAANTEQFSGMFEGNGMTISNMQMHIDNNTVNIGLAAGVQASNNFETILSSSVNNTYSGVGFFGTVSAVSAIRNLRMENSTISADAGIRLYAVGGLVGYGEAANIANSEVELNSITGTEYIGGLVGFGEDATISSSSSIVGSIEGDDTIGGLVGEAAEAIIISASAIVNTIESTGDIIGGLVGNGILVTISSSSAIVDTIESTGNIIGGLVAFGQSATINSSSAIVDTLKSTSTDTGGFESLGGLVGFGFRARISNSFALSTEINGNTNVHQLVGGPDDPDSITDSYWQDGVMATSAAFLSNVRGTVQTMDALQSPSSFTDIYNNWANAWCDPATGAFITDSSNALAVDANRLWDLGTGSQYPVISSACFGDRLTPQLQRTLIQRITNDQPLFPLP